MLVYLGEIAELSVEVLKEAARRYGTNKGYIDCGFYSARKGNTFIAGLLSSDGKNHVYGFCLSFADIGNTRYCGIKTYSVNKEGKIDFDKPLKEFPQRFNDEEYENLLNLMMLTTRSSWADEMDNIKTIPRKDKNVIQVSLADFISQKEKIPVIYNIDNNKKFIKPSESDDYNYIEVKKVSSNDLDDRYTKAYAMMGKEHLRAAVFMNMGWDTAVVAFRVGGGRLIVNVPHAQLTPSDPVFVTFTCVIELKNGLIRRPYVSVGDVVVKMKTSELVALSADVFKQFSGKIEELQLSPDNKISMETNKKVNGF